MDPNDHDEDEAEDKSGMSAIADQIDQLEEVSGQDFKAAEDAPPPDRRPAPAAKEPVKEAPKAPPAADKPIETPAVEQKPAGEAPAKPAAPKTEPAKGEKPPRSLEEIEKDGKAEPGRHMPEKDRANWRKMSKVTEEAVGRARAAEKNEAALRQEIDQLKQSVGKPPAELEAELKRLREIEFLHSPETSSLVTGEYDGKIKEADGKVRTLLTAEFVRRGKSPEEAAELLQRAIGGDRLDSKHDANVWLADIDRQLRDGKIQPRDAERLRGAITAYFDAKEAKDEAVKQAPAKLEEYRKQLTEKGTKERAAAGAIAEQHFKQRYAEFEDLQPVTITDQMTAQEKADAEKHNEYIEKELGDVLQKAMQATGPKGQVDLAIEAVRAYHLDKENKRLAEELAQLRADLGKEKGTVTKIKRAQQLSRAIEGPTGGTPVAAPTGDLGDAFDRTMDRLGA